MSLFKKNSPESLGFPANLISFSIIRESARTGRYSDFLWFIVHTVHHLTVSCLFSSFSGLKKFTKDRKRSWIHGRNSGKRRFTLQKCKIQAKIRSIPYEDGYSCDTLRKLQRSFEWKFSFYCACMFYFLVELMPRL